MLNSIREYGNGTTKLRRYNLILSTQNDGKKYIYKYIPMWNSGRDDKKYNTPANDASNNLD